MPYNPSLGLGPTGGTQPGMLNPGNYGGVGTAANQVENIFQRPPIEEMKIYARNNGYLGYGHLLRTMGRVKGCFNPSTAHYEEQFKEDLLRINAVITPSGGAGANMVVSLTADSMFNTGATQGGAARQASYPQSNMIVELPSGLQAFIVSKDVTVTPHRLTLRPTLSTTDLDDEITGGERLHLSFNAYGEGSGRGNMIQDRLIRYENKFGIVKTYWAITGSEMTNHIYVEPIPGVKGTVLKRLKANAEYHHMKAMDGLLLFGQYFNNITSYDTGGLNIDVSIPGVSGLLPETRLNSSFVAPTLASYSTADLDTIANAIEDERGIAQNVMFGLTGRDIQQARENGLQEFVQQNLAPFFSMMAVEHGGWDFQSIADTDEFKGLSFAFGLHSIQKSNITFHYKKMPIFNDVMRAGARVGDTAVYKYPATTIYMPLGARARTSTGSEAPAFGYEYKEAEGYSRHLVINERSGAGTTQGEVSHDRDIKEAFVTSEIGPNHYCLNQYVYEEGV